MNKMRIGHGYDTHAFEIGKPLILCGVEIPYDKGMKAHSDGDVVIHAVCDALLGAAGLGDIGQHFPDTDNQYQNIDSRLLLRHVHKLLIDRRYTIGNIDITILAQEPRLSSYIVEMRNTLAQDVHVSLHDINIKATTTEEMGFVGRREGITCYAVALIYS